MASDREALPIKLGELAEHRERASKLLALVKWKPRDKVLLGGSTTQTPSAREYREVNVTATPDEEISILKSAKRVSADPLLLAEEVNHALSVIRLGIQIGARLSQLYMKASNLDGLVEQNQKGQLPESYRAEFRAKYQTASAITIFGLAYYVVHELEGYMSEEVGRARVNFTGIPEVNLRGPVDAMNCTLFYFGCYLEKTGIETSLEFVRIALEYFKGILNELELKKKSFEYVEPFSQRTYALEQSEFVIDGFSVEFNGGVSSVAFNRTDINTIVGNRDAKHHARRLAQRLVCYDPRTKRNVMYELGGFPNVSLGYGEPGTGKSMIIAATATLINDLCQQLGLPFLFHPMPDTVISTFQGGSAERMDAWMRPLRDPTRIIYAPIDDAENNLEERTRQGVSAGVREVIGVFLRNTEGAYAINNGNSAVGIYTNIPEQIDRAVMSRVIARAYIGGAKDPHDFLDQDYLWWKRYQAIDAAFVAMQDPAGYAYLESQRLVGSIAEIGERITEPRQTRIRDIFQKIAKEQDLHSQMFFAVLYAEVKKVFPFFTSRDVRNMQRAADARFMDFDLPSEWFENPETFFRQDHDRKLDMVKELMRGTMGTLSFADVRLEESIRYLDTMVQIADQGRERQIADEVTRIEILTEARRRYEGGVKE